MDQMLAAFRTEVEMEYPRKKLMMEQTAPDYPDYSLSLFVVERQVKFGHSRLRTETRPAIWAEPPGTRQFPLAMRTANLTSSCSHDSRL